MQFAMCPHGNIGMTCPQCKGRQPAAGFATAPAPAVAAPARRAPAAPADDTLDALWESQPWQNRMQIILGGALDEVVRDSERKVEATSNRDAAQVKGFWQGINKATTVAEHEAQRAEKGLPAGVNGIAPGSRENLTDE